MLCAAPEFSGCHRCRKQRDASANDDPHKCYPTGPSSTDCGSKRRYTTTIQSLAEKKKLTLRKVFGHKSAVTHKLMRTTSPDPASRNAGSPILTEQTGELDVGNQRDVVVSSSDFENSAGLLGNTQDASSDAPPLETEPQTAVDANQAYIAKTAADHDNNSIFPMLATLSGAMLASGVGWYLVRPGPRTALS